MIIHTLPFLLRDKNDIKMADECFESLRNSDPQCVIVLFNQGFMSNAELKKYLRKYEIEFHILGEGHNVGIPYARESCMTYIWKNFQECKFISEIHVDMLFPQGWYKPLISYLESNDEPMITPGIITQFGEIHPCKRGFKSFEMPNNVSEILKICESLQEDRVVTEGFVHPVIHKSEALKEIGGYHSRLLRGKQGYEDDSVLLGYRYYMGTRNNWKPKAYLASYVYHATMAQRMSLANINSEFRTNLNGLFKQYGSYGFLQLAKIHDSEEFKNMADSIINGA